MAKLKTKLSAAMLALIAAGASAPVLMDQFQDEKEGTSLIAYPDRGGVWTICGGVTYVNGKPVLKGMKLTRAQCDVIDKAEQAKALAWVDKNIHIPLALLLPGGLKGCAGTPTFPNAMKPTPPH